MKQTTIALLVAGLLVAGPNALAQFQVSGSVTGGAIATDLKSSNGFRFDEYRDMRSGGLLGAEIRGESDTHFLRFFGENIGRDDQFMELKGGKYGEYKYSLTNNNIIHNLTHNAITPFTGVGTNTLSFPGALGATPTTNTSLWNGFDYKIKHENYGGTFELQSALSSPFYLRATFNQKDTKGIKPIGGSERATTGGLFSELPVLVDFTTTDMSAEAGYATKTTHYSLNLSWSKFRDNNDFQIWRNPFVTSGTSTQDSMTIAADNSYWKAGANAMWKQLPMNSTLAVRGTFSRAYNSLPVAQTYLLPSSAGAGNINSAFASTPAVSTFNGDVRNESVAASLTSQLSRSLDSRVYWNWNKRANRSTEIEFSTTVAAGSLGGGCNFDMATGTPSSNCTNERFHYKKNNLGFDLQYRLTPQDKLSGGWDYARTERERIDFDKTKDNTYYVEWKRNWLENLTGRLKYQHLQRRSEFLLGGFDQTLPGENFFNFFEINTRRFDLNSRNEDMIKLVVDASPIPFLDLGGGFNWRQAHYKEVVFGRNNDKRYEAQLNASYGDPGVFRVSAFWDYQVTWYESTHWTGVPPPAISGVATGYQWQGKWRDRNDVLGLSADWPVREGLRLKGSYIWQSAKGTVGFNTTSSTVTLANINNFDNYRKQALDLRAIYAINKTVDLNVGFAHESYHIDDIAFNNYNYTVVVGGQNFLSGAFANPNFNANFLYATLKFSVK